MTWIGISVELLHQADAKQGPAYIHQLQDLAAILYTDVKLLTNSGDVSKIVLCRLDFTVVVLALIYYNRLIDTTNKQSSLDNDLITT